MIAALSRWGQIVGLVSLHGLVCLMRLAALSLRPGARAARRRLLYRSLAQLFCALGATFIKIAQFLSTRPDLVSAELAAQLATLQDRVGPFPYPQVWRTLRAELGQAPEEVFCQLDPYPIASASVAQVHRGQLRGGQAVAVKVLRPGIERTVALDLRLMRLAARALDRLPWVRGLAPREVVAQFAGAIGQQLDLRLEAQNNERFAKIFAADPEVRVPALVPALCTGRVLCMELILGQKVLDPPQPGAEGERLARLGVRALLAMIFQHGFVHADLHPGNLMVDREGRLVLLDLGLVARLGEDHRGALLRLLAAWISGSAAQVQEALLGLLPGRGPPRDPAALGLEVQALMARYRSVQLGEVQLGRVLLELLQILRRQRLRPEPALTMVILALGVVEGVGRQLAPRMDLVGQALAFYLGHAARQGRGASPAAGA